MMQKISFFLTGLFLCFALPIQAENFDWNTPQEVHHGSKEIKVYRDPNCNCCHKWITHLEKHQFNVIDLLTSDMASVKEAVKLPTQLASCHTAIIDGYIIEGHVPADDIKRLLRDKPDIAGLSVPRMPVGTPGMEMGNRKDDFSVFSFTKDNDISVFKHYQQSSPANNDTSHKH